MEEITSGMITFQDSLKFKYHICRVDFIFRDNKDYEYIFTPNYKVIDILPDEFQGIPGLNLDCRKESYYRKNMEPVFITERSPSKNREDLHELLSEVGMDHLNRLEWIIRTDRHYFGDTLDVIRYTDSDKKYIFNDVIYKSSNLCRRILNAMAMGANVEIDGRSVDDISGPIIADVLRSLLMSDRRAIYRNNKNKNIGSGRKPTDIDIVSLKRAKGLMSSGVMTSDEAAKDLGISRMTLYRHFKKNGL